MTRLDGQLPPKEEGWTGDRQGVNGGKKAHQGQRKGTLSKVLKVQCGDNLIP